MVTTEPIVDARLFAESDSLLTPEETRAINDNLEILYGHPNQPFARETVAKKMQADQTIVSMRRKGND